MRRVLFAIAVLLSPAARADDAANAKAIIERAIKARGDKIGAEPVPTTWNEKITLDQDVGIKEKLVLDTAWTVAPPDKLRVDMKFAIAGNTFDLTYALNGESVWLLVNGKVQENASDMLGQALGEMSRMWVTSLHPLVTDEGFKLSTAKEEKVNGKPAVGVEVRNGKRPVVTLHFDKETHLLVKRTAKVKDASTGDKEELEEMVLSGYKDDGAGHKYHTKVSVSRDGKLFYVSAVSAPKALKDVDAKLFEKPKN